MAYISGNAAAHQRMHIGKLAMVSGTSAITRDLPPFVIVQGVNVVYGVNVIGMRRAGYDGPEIDGVREAFRILYMQRDLVKIAVERIQKQLAHLDAVAEFVDFIRSSPNGIVSATARVEKHAA